MNKWKLAAAATAGLAIAGGGAALAAEKLSSSDNEGQAMIDDAAQRLNVTPSALSDALKKALEDRVDAAVAAGRITKAEGDELKQRIESSEFPLFLGHPGFGHHLFRGLDAAASYLGTTEDALRTELESGKTLAEVAQEKGKSVDGLVQALYDDAKQHLDAAVSAGKLTRSDENAILSDLKQHITNFVNGVRPPFGRFGNGFRPHGDL
jgi:predicted DNA-binding protein (UPF0251 family)